jgi:hypothetical protein
VFICTFEEIVQVRSSNWKTSGKPNQIRVRLIFTENFTNFVVAVSSPAEDQAVSTLTNFFISTKFSVAKITCFSYALFRLCNQESLTVFPGYLSQLYIRHHLSTEFSVIMFRSFELANYCIHAPCSLAYQPPASSTFFSEQTSHQQSTSSTFPSERISTDHQQPVKRTG